MVLFHAIERGVTVPGARGQYDRFSDADRARMLAMADDGGSIRQIARAMKRPKSSVGLVLKQLRERRASTMAQEHRGRSATT